MRKNAMHSRLSHFGWSAIAVCTAIAVQPLFAATFVVPPDRDLVRQATAIVIASPLESHTELRHERIVETVTTMSIEEVLKGSIHRDAVEVREPGGIYEKRISSIPGVPRFKDGERYLLFLIRTDEGIWRVLDLVLGKFTFETDTLGHDVLMRDSQEIAGWDSDGKAHREQNREARPFLDFIRTTLSGGPAAESYLIPAESLMSNAFVGKKRRAPVLFSTYTPTSYTYSYSSCPPPNGSQSCGARWNVFPSSVGFYSTGANAAALTAMNTAIAAWNNDAGSNVNLVNAGVDSSGTHNNGILSPDGQNTVAFERDLTAEYGAPPFSCPPGGSSYSGTLGIAAVTTDSGTHTGPNSETFYTSAEGDVEMNVGLSTCTYLINIGDFNSAVAHELGHTLGFRHSDQERNLLSGTATSCSGDTALECTGAQIMTAYIPTGKNAVLQSWDHHAVDLLYPNVAVSPPTGVTATAQTPTSILVSWTAASGASSYRVYRNSGSGWALITSGGCSALGNVTSCTDSVTSGVFGYKVTAVAGVESAFSNVALETTTVYTDDPLVANNTTVKAIHLSEIRTSVDTVHRIAGLGAVTFTDTAASGLVIKAIHVTELRSNLDAAMTQLGLTTGGWTDGSLSGIAVKAIHFQEIRNRMR